MTLHCNHHRPHHYNHHHNHRHHQRDFHKKKIIIFTWWTRLAILVLVRITSNPMMTFDQLDLADEQAAAIRRELDARREKVQEMERVSLVIILWLRFIWGWSWWSCGHNDHLQNRKLMPKFVLKDMEGLYIDGMNTAINTLKVSCQDNIMPTQYHAKTISC